MTINIGDIQNRDTDTTSDETIVIYYTLLVEELATTDSADTFDNIVMTSWSDGTETIV